MQWSDKDPRLVSDKRLTIVILAPDLKGAPVAGMGYVETKHGWNITTAFDWHPLIGEDDTWPELWVWCQAPEWQYPETLRKKG